MSRIYEVLIYENIFFSMIAIFVSRKACHDHCTRDCLLCIEPLTHLSLAYLITVNPPTTADIISSFALILRLYDYEDRLLALYGFHYINLIGRNEIYAITRAVMIVN